MSHRTRSFRFKLAKCWQRLQWAYSWQLNTPLVEQPRYLLKMRERQTWVTFPFMLLPIWIAFRPMQSAWGFVVLVISSILLSIALTHFMFIPLNNRFRLRMARNRFKVCTQCAYVLRGLDARGACPECGTDFDIDQVVHMWRAYLWTKRRRSQHQGPAPVPGSSRHIPTK